MLKPDRACFDIPGNLQAPQLCPTEPYFRSKPLANTDDSQLSKRAHLVLSMRIRQFGNYPLCPHAQTIGVERRPMPLLFSENYSHRCKGQSFHSRPAEQKEGAAIPGAAEPKEGAAIPGAAADGS